MDNLNTTLPTGEQQLHIQSDQVGVRLDRYLTTILHDLSRTAIQQLISEEGVLVNQKPSKSGYQLRLQDEIHLLRSVQSPVLREIKPLAQELDIVYEDSDLLVVNKAAGMVVHPAAGHQDDTLVNILFARYPELQEVESSEEDIRPGIVHRLDRDTSGLIIVAKNTRTQAALIDLMKEHAVEKRYLALVEGVVTLDKGTIDAPIGRDSRHRQQMTITALDGREARTHFRVFERFSRHTLLLLQLETGRTHQIRVHLKAIGYPVVGDTVYGSGHLRGITLARQFLHAYQLRFTHPVTGQILELEAPLPADLQAVLDHTDVL
jgi:23S rRNA pseudouridine1911/1915/1917 synthase